MAAANGSDAYTSAPQINDAHLRRGYPDSTPDSTYMGAASDGLATPGNPAEVSPLAQSVPNARSSSALSRYEEIDDTRGSSVQQLEGAGLHRTASSASGTLPTRGNTLKKKGSLSRKSSLKRSNSRRSVNAGSLRGMSAEEKREADQRNSVFYTPIPTSGAPTEILAGRFQAWRKMLKDLITYFREVQASYENKAKALLKVSNVINNIASPPVFMKEGGIADAGRILSDYHKHAIAEAIKAKDIEQDVIGQLTGLRQDLAAKIKEIKSLSGDFKNTVEKEKEGTRKAVTALEQALGLADHDPHAVTGKDDPYIIKLGVDRQVERQIDEENYLHRAYLNLEGSGRELESIVIGEIQKAYNALAGIMKRDSDEAYDIIDRLRSGPITIPKDLEWTSFIDQDPHFIQPDVLPRKLEDIYFPGKNHPAVAEIRAGMLERKSKYLKSYTPGWYVLSPTHLHEFKSADRIYTQPPVMSLYLGDQRLGNHSQPGSSSHKFMLKGRQTGSMHRGHSWVFRAESYDTMLAWFDDIKALIEKSGEERVAFVRTHARSMSNSSMTAGSVSEGSVMDEDEADAMPFSANNSLTHQDKSMTIPQRPSPGGRFPSDFSTNKYLQRQNSVSEASSDDRDAVAGAVGLPQHYDGSTLLRPEEAYRHQTQHSDSFSTNASTYPNTMTTTGGPYHSTSTAHRQPAPQLAAFQPMELASPLASHPVEPANQRHSSDYKTWMAPAAGSAAVAEVVADNAEPPQHDRSIGSEALHPERITDLPTPAQPFTNSSLEGNDYFGQREPVSPISPAATESPALTMVDDGLDHRQNIGALNVANGSLASTAMTAGTVRADRGVVVPQPGIRASTVGVIYSTTDANADTAAGAGKGTDTIPPLVRHTTDVSISDLHIPGEFPDVRSP